MKATSSNESLLTATASSTATPGTYGVKVHELAKGQVNSAGYSSPTDAIANANATAAAAKQARGRHRNDDINMRGGPIRMTVRTMQAFMMFSRIQGSATHSFKVSITTDIGGWTSLVRITITFFWGSFPGESASRPRAPEKNWALFFWGSRL